MTGHVSSELSPYLDGELDERTRARVELHLGECLDCARMLADLRAIAAAAPSLPGRLPTRDLWPGIAGRLDQAEVVPLDSARRAAAAPSRHRFGWRELIAASVVMAAIGGGSVWWALHSGAPADAGSALLPSSASRPAPSQVEFADAEYDVAVRELEQTLAAGQDRLDPATVRTIEQSLARIDAAISEARAAIQRDPANAYLSRQIAANMRRKLHLLRTATNAIAART